MIGGAQPALDDAFDSFAPAEMVAVPRDAMLGHLRPVGRYAVDRRATERRGALTMHQYRVSAAAYRGSEVAIHLRLCVADPNDKRVVLSIPGGGGAFQEETLWWLSGRFQENHAAVDWLGRGRSPEHPHLRCDYDPMYMPEDHIEDAFLFHNLAAIWAALDWLFHIGYRPSAVAGGSWGGVLSFLIAALDRRVARIFATFGCGGMGFYGVEKRSMWDAAIEAMGPRRTALWRSAFDPLLRLGDIAARVYYETAANDKFFSIGMAMETVRRVATLDFLSIVANQDHTMQPYGVQPYVVQHLPPEQLRQCAATNDIRLEWDARAASVIAAPLPDDSPDIRLLWSEQLPAHGNMSREWFALAADEARNGRAVFRMPRTSPEAAALFFLNRPVRLDAATTINTSTAIFRAGAQTPPAAASAAALHRTLLTAAGADPWPAPVGDKSHPPVAAEEAGWRVRFSAMPRARVTRFGVRPWLLPRRWLAIEVALAAPLPETAAPLVLFLSRRYQRNDEEAVGQAFSDAESRRDGARRIYRFRRDRFMPTVVVEERFRSHALPPAEAVLDDFDAVGIIDPAGRVAADIVLVSIEICQHDPAGDFRR
ncbi:MAG TPA: hypothetical protein VMF86_09545 [Stellaceae bacterium]|nr:hypothetical protein [Stellaceae bacterium]